MAKAAPAPRKNIEDSLFSAIEESGSENSEDSNDVENADTEN